MASIIAVDMKKSPSNAKMAVKTQPERGFSYSRDFFAGLVDQALAHAKKLGATDAGADASEACGLSVNVRKGDVVNSGDLLITMN